MMDVNDMFGRGGGDINISHLTRAHPCFNGEVHDKSGRIHLPVSPVCNIRCAFCRRSFNKTESRPGVAAVVLSPQGALEILRKALKICPQITVAGIAGPGDPLASDHALRTFELIDAEYPLLIKCLSTNGLLLSEKAEKIARLEIRTVTVTINAVRPEILARLCSRVVAGGSVLEGTEAAEYLIAAQLEGIRKISRLGSIVKVNTVLVPRINERHIGDIARTAAEAGASMINIIPLIPQNELRDHPSPDCSELRKARKAAEEYLTVFKHCRQCRADAAGIPGVSEFRDVLYGEAPMVFSHG